MRLTARMRTATSNIRPSAAVALLVMPLLASVVGAQELPKEPNWREIRTKALAPIDRRTTQQWVEAQVELLLTSQDAQAVQTVGSELITRMREQYQAGESSTEFKNGLAEIFNEAFLKHYKPTPAAAEAPHPLGAAIVLMVMREFGTPICLPAFRAALADPTPGPKLVAAEGLARLLRQMNDQTWNALLPDIQKAAIAENNSVTLSRLYRLVLTDVAGRQENATTALLAILDGRLAGFAQRGRDPSEADAEAIAWLTERARTTNNNTLRMNITRHAAQLLAEAAAAYLGGKLTEVRRERLERTILDVEPRLETLVKLIAPNAALPDPTLRAAVLAGGDGQTAAMESALGKWVGGPAGPGILNQAPFNFPQGMGVKSRAPQTQTATAPA